MRTGTAYVNSQTAYLPGTSCRDVDGCLAAMEKNAPEEEEEKDDERERTKDLANLSPEEIGFRKRVIRHRQGKMN